MTSKTNFEQKYKSLNKGQKEAVDTIYGPVMVVAGPGTGKTTLLTLRIANILKQTDTKPEQILALTFTDSGAKAMRDKLRDIIGSEATRVGIYTYHSFAEQILRKYNDYFAEFNNFRFISGDDAITLFEDIIDKGDFERIKSTFSPYFNIGKIIQYIQSLKKEFVSPDDVLRLVDQYEEGLRNDPDSYSSRGKSKGEIKVAVLAKFKMVEKMRELATVYGEYEERKRKQKRYDFDDVINVVVKKVETDDTLKYEIAEEYQFVLADEHQDANRSQNKILDFFSVMVDSPNLMVVGDEKQAIFRFQGGTLENFAGFSQKYPDAKVINLKENYRSHQRILDYSFDLMSKRSELLLNKDNLVAKGNDVGEGKIHFFELFDKESECEFVGEKIKTILTDTSDDVAVIYRTNKEKDHLSRVFDVLGISYVSQSDNELFQNRFALEIIYFLKVLANFEDNQNFSKTLCSSIFDLDIGEVQKINKEVSRSEKGVFEILKSNTDPKSKDIVELVSSLGDFALKNEPVRLIEEFARKTAYLKTSDEKLLKEKLDILRSFADIARQVQDKADSTNIKDLNNFIDKAIEYEVKITIPKSEDKSRVNLMTAHKSKGLEYDHVFVVNMTKSDWGKSQHKDAFISLERLLQIEGGTNDDLEDSRKLLYVAMTRARKSLVLTFPRFKSDGKENEVSGFIDEIRGDLLTKEVVEQKYSQKFLAKEIPRDKIKFYQDLFLGESFSVTALNNYLECPNKYLFNNLLRFPFAMSLSLEVGNAVHSALEEYGLLILRKKQHSGETLYTLFEKNLRSRSIRERDVMTIIKQYKEDIVYLGDHFNLGDESLLKPEFKLEYTYPFTYEGDREIFIRGSVDRVDRMGEEYVVTDFKTGKVKSRNEVAGLNASADGNYLRQITFYKMIMERMDRGMNVTRGQIYFVQRNEKEEPVVHSFELTHEMVSELDQKLQNTCKEIMSGEFLLKGCDESDCEFCKLRRTINL